MLLCLQKERIMRKILIAIHGFGDMRQENFRNLIEWTQDADYELITFDLYDMTPHPVWTDWLKKAIEVVKSIDFMECQVTILGFSMGGVIASYLSDKFPIHKLILIAPSFKVYGVKQVLSYCSDFKFKEGAKPEINDRDKVLLEYSIEFAKLINMLRPYQKKISVPVLIIQGSADDVVPPIISKQTYHKVKHIQKRLYLIPEGPHELLEDERVGKEVFDMIDMYMNDVNV